MRHVRKVMCIIETSRSHGRGLLRGIARYARLHGPWMFYRESPEEGFFSAEKKQRLTNWADGFIYWPHFKKGSTGITPYKKAAELSTIPLPAIMPISSDKSEFKRINFDVNLPAIANMAVDHLTQRGFRHLAYCGFPVAWSVNFGNIIETAAENANCDITIYNAKGNESCIWQQEHQVLAEWIRKLPKPIGLIACNDDRSQDIIEACKIADILVPEELAILGVDNDEFICELSHVPISSIAVDTEKAGYQAAETLDEMMNNQTPATHCITIEPSGVVTRRSTDVFATQDEHVALALAYIHENAIHPIQVSDVVENASLSRRILEQRFKIELNRTILSEIRRKRIELLQNFLTETDMPLSRISLAMNFPSIDNMSQYFKRATGQSIAAWRKIHRPA